MVVAGEAGLELRRQEARQESLGMPHRGAHAPVPLSSLWVFLSLRVSLSVWQCYLESCQAHHYTTMQRVFSTLRLDSESRTSNFGEAGLLQEHWESQPTGKAKFTRTQSWPSTYFKTEPGSRHLMSRTVPYRPFLSIYFPPSLLSFPCFFCFVFHSYLSSLSTNTLDRI